MPENQPSGHIELIQRSADHSLLTIKYYEEPVADLTEAQNFPKGNSLRFEGGESA